MDTPLDELESLGAPDAPPPLASPGALESFGACTAMPSITARAMALTRLIATAAATDTPPDDVLAAGVLAAPPLPSPPFAVDVSSAKPRSCATCSLTPFDAWPVESDGAAAPVASCGAPAAEALAVAEVSEEPYAASVTAPAAVRFRRRVASAMWFAMVSASETPIAADLPCAEPSAVVFADAVWSALALNAPEMVSAAPGVTVASVVMFERAIATDGTIATLPPAAPVLARTSNRWVVEALRLRSLARLGMLMSSAVVVSSTMASASEAPIPTLDAPE